MCAAEVATVHKLVFEEMQLWPAAVSPRHWVSHLVFDCISMPAAAVSLQLSSLICSTATCIEI